MYVSSPPGRASRGSTSRSGGRHRRWCCRLSPVMALSASARRWRGPWAFSLARRSPARAASSMSEVDNPSRAALEQPAVAGPDREIEFGDLTRWLSRRWVSVAAVTIILVQLGWKANFLSRFYFRQDDIHFTELALHSRLGWGYLSYVGSGHLHPRVLLIVCVLARVALYNWGAASAVLLVMLTITSLAAWRLLRALIGSRPALLIPLALCLATPLTFPHDSWWQSGIESAPIQAVIFLALLAHIHYVRS